MRRSVVKVKMAIGYACLGHTGLGCQIVHAQLRMVSLAMCLRQPGERRWQIYADGTLFDVCQRIDTRLVNLCPQGARDRKSVV